MKIFAEVLAQAVSNSRSSRHSLRFFTSSNLEDFWLEETLFQEVGEFLKACFGDGSIVDF